MKLCFGEQARTSWRGKENYAIHVANLLIDHLEKRYKAGLTGVRGIGLAGGNASQIHASAVTIKWNKRRWRSGVNDARPCLTVIDGHGVFKSKVFFNPQKESVRHKVVERVLEIWESRDIDFTLKQEMPATAPRIEMNEIFPRGAVPKERVQAWFRQGDWDKEEYLVAAIKRHLVTAEQRRQLGMVDVSIEDMLNGRVDADGDFVTTQFYHEWNTWLGFYCFGSDGRRRGEPYPPPAEFWTQAQMQSICEQVADADMVRVTGPCRSPDDVIYTYQAGFGPLTGDPEHEVVCSLSDDSGVYAYAGFTEDALSRAEVMSNQITIEDTDGDMIVFTLFDHTPKMLVLT